MPKQTGRPFEGAWQFGANTRSTWRAVARVLYAARVETLATDDVSTVRDVTAPATRDALALACSESLDAIAAVEAGAGYVHRFRLDLAQHGPPYHHADIFLAVPEAGVGRVFAVAHDDRLVMSDGILLRGKYRVEGMRAERLQTALEPILTMFSTADVPSIPHASTPPYASLRKQVDGGAGYLYGGGLGLEIFAALAVIEGDRGDGRYYDAMIGRLLRSPSIATAPAIAIVQSAADRSPRRKPEWTAALGRVLHSPG